MQTTPRPPSSRLLPLTLALCVGVLIGASLTAGAMLVAVYRFPDPAPPATLAALLLAIAILLATAANLVTRRNRIPPRAENSRL